MRRLFSSVLRSEKGATAIEYALIASLVSISLMFAATTIGTETKQLYGYLVEKLAPPEGG
jgi:Flp pilus assembly pilin Flp